MSFHYAKTIQIRFYPTDLRNCQNLLQHVENYYGTNVHKMLRNMVLYSICVMQRLRYWSMNLAVMIQLRVYVQPLLISAHASLKIRGGTLQSFVFVP